MEENMIFVCGIMNIYLLELEIKKQKIIKELIGHNEIPVTIKTILHLKYGECLISQGLHNDRIILWINKNINQKII